MTVVDVAAAVQQGSLSAVKVTLDALERIRLSFGHAEMEVVQEFCRSKDGTRIPMFIVRPGPDWKTAESPVLLHGYGGWGQALLPGFRPEIAAWTAAGGTCVLAHLRGGGEYGNGSYRPVRGLNKQDLIDGFCAVAEHLVDSGIAAPGAWRKRSGATAGRASRPANIVGPSWSPPPSSKYPW